ncbi:MAG: hypothetical protein OEW05_01860 [Candidatus Aminicenantes bacterium]|nr:hypothetical protein [Candidatus Aminicenantes bacterium]
MKVFVGFLAIIFVFVGSLLAYDNSPSRVICFPEVIWAEATGGGTWTSELQITNMTANNTLIVSFMYGGGLGRGPFALTIPSGVYTSLKISNILATLQSLDPAFTYYGRVGCFAVATQDEAHLIQGAVRTSNGNYSKTFQGLTLGNSNLAATSQSLMIQNLASNATYRTSVGFISLGPLTVEFTIFDANGLIVGSPFTKTFILNDFQSFNPFIQAGAPYPAQSHDNCWLRIRPTAGTGTLLCFGATANNFTNDPAAHIAVQYQ